MANTTITFRLTKYQLARGLWLIRKLEPNYQPSSTSQLVKLIYLDYLSKMNLGKSDIVPPEIMLETQILCTRKKSPKTTFEDFIKAQPSHQPAIPAESPTNEESSIINTVTDFSPPLSWLIED